MDLRTKIIEKYSDYLTTEGKRPNSVAHFMKSLKKEESEFYAHFASFDVLEGAYFETFYSNVMDLLSKDDGFNDGDARSQLLSFYFTYFELMTANRSLVLQLLPDTKMKRACISNLDAFKKRLTHFVGSLDIDFTILDKLPLEKVKEKGIEKMAWMQFIAVLEFWIADSSANFEKTDVFIEKSINTTFDVINIPALERIIDFGKFIYHEKMGTK